MSHAWMELAGLTVTAVAVTGVLLNNHRRRACFVAWAISNTLSAALHLAMGLYAMTARDAIFLALCFHGWRAWGRTTRPGKPDAKETR